MTKPSSFVTTVDLKIAGKLQADLLAKGFTLSQPQHTVFQAKSNGVSCTLYKSGKLMVQGKEMGPFIEFYLEPEILNTFQYQYQELAVAVDAKPHIGIDESGKGDFFGPLCIAGVFGGEKEAIELKKLGVRDSKQIQDASILKLGKKIRADFTYHVVKINPKKYNELYGQFKNLNRLLAWGHATTIEQLVEKTQCYDVIIDQFADEHVVATALKRKSLEVHLTQRHRAEADLIVAAASILARCAFLEGLDQLGQQFDLKLPKGASAATISAGKTFVSKHGSSGLENVAKLHFKTLDAILH